MEEEVIITACCTVCGVESSRVLTSHEHPVVPGRAVCGLCLEALEECDGEECCAWCGDGGELLVCDGCGRNWCRDCLSRHLGSSYVERADASEEWRECPACEPAGGGGGFPPPPDADPDEAARLLRFESELAETQEKLEPEMVERLRLGIAAEIEDEEAIDDELDECLRLLERKLELLEREHAAAQERAEAAGVDLAMFYMALEAANAAGGTTLSTAWAKAPKLASRKRGVVRACARGSGEDLDDEEVSYEAPEDAEARAWVEAAEAENQAKRPMKLKRSRGGAMALVGETVGATGFDERRKKELGSEYEAVYSATLESIQDERVREQAEEIDELDENWAREIKDPAERKLIEENEKRREQKAKVVRRHEEEEVVAVKRKRSRDNKEVSRRKEVVSSSGPLSSSPEVEVVEVHSTTPRRAPVWERGGRRRAWIVGQDADGMIYLPAERAQHLIRCPATIGRQKNEDEAGHVAVCGPLNKKISRELAVLRRVPDGIELTRCERAKTQVVVDSKDLGAGESTVITRAAAVRFGGLSSARDARHHPIEAYVLLPLREGDKTYFELPRHDPEDFVRGHHHHHHYQQQQEERKHRAGARTTTTAGTGRSREEPICVDSEDDDRGRSGKCCLSSSSSSSSSSKRSKKKKLSSGSSPTRLTNLKVPKRKDIGDVLDENDLSAETQEATKLEQEKRDRIKARKERLSSRASLEAAAATSSPPRSPVVEAAAVGRSSSSDVERVALNDGETEAETVYLPSYLCGGVLKAHQIEGARFIFEQTIESVDQLDKYPTGCEDPIPLGCVLAYSMGLGKSLTTIAYLAALFNHGRAKTQIKTALVVAPANVVRNWEAEFAKWCDSDSALLKRVRVFDSRRDRLGQLRAWSLRGGVLVVSYDSYQKMVCTTTTTAKDNPPRQKKKKKKSESLDQLAARGALVPGRNVISVVGRPDVRADLLVGGVISYQRATYACPKAFCWNATRDVSQLDGMKMVTYGGKPLESLLVDDDDDDEKGEDSFVVEARKALQDPGPDVLVLDEAHLVKNPNNKRFKAFAGIRTRRRVALTGTPLQNNLMEYHSMITFVRGTVLGTRAEFKKNFEDPIKNGMCVDSSKTDVKKMQKRVYVLGTKIRDFVLRKDQALLAQEIDKTEYLVVAKLTSVQRRLYAGFVAGAVALNALLAHQPLLKLGNHPLTHVGNNSSSSFSSSSSSSSTAAASGRAAAPPLIAATDSIAALTSNLLLVSNPLELKKKKKKKKRGDDEEEEVVELESSSSSSSSSEGSRSLEEEEDAPLAEPAKPWNWHDEVAAMMRAEYAVDPPVEDTVRLSSKMSILFDIIARSMVVDDKVVVFSQSIPTLDYIERVLRTDAWCDKRRDLGSTDSRRWTMNADILRIDGGTGSTERQRRVEAFESGSKARVFLLSTKAGNMGINLVSANRVVLFDSSWNPAIDKQALCRCFRYGQKKKVFIYRLVMQGFEHTVYKRAMQKDHLSLRCVDDGAYERMWAAEDLENLATLDDDNIDVCLDHVQEDPVLHGTLARHKDKIVETTVTDTFYRENADEKLDEAEFEEAMDEYDREKQGLPTRAQEAAAAIRQAAAHQPPMNIPPAAAALLSTMDISSHHITTS
ncbi:hypothetical protein CTAYLR_001363 [Chrysophaeum taylorii]|uniref:ATP-dependent helicase ATRX n=1 Tax=Chrysophaeum taylorii TaxID=2483200 RepID=A0AAD7U5P9_9STRA|nr:hypothetical protein CTAYLR_001363 [Chrysophaeum taylorii]